MLAGYRSRKNMCRAVRDLTGLGPEQIRALSEDALGSLLSDAEHAVRHGATARSAGATAALKGFYEAACQVTPAFAGASRSC
jgi:hypothetical protein